MNTYGKLASGTLSFGHERFILKFCPLSEIFAALYGNHKDNAEKSGLRVTAHNLVLLLKNAIYLEKK